MRAGCSTLARCAASGTTSSREPRIARCDGGSVWHRNRLVVGTRNHQRVRSDVREVGAQIHRSDDLAAGRVARRACCCATCRDSAS